MDGSDRFKIDIDGTVVGPPVAGPDVLYCPVLQYEGAEGPSVGLVAVDALEERTRWAVPVVNGSIGRPVVTLDRGDGVVTVTVHDTDAESFADTYITALATGDGTVRRRHHLEDHAAVQVHDDTIYSAGEHTGTVRQLALSAKPETSQQTD